MTTPTPRTESDEDRANLARGEIPAHIAMPSHVVPTPLTDELLATARTKKLLSSDPRLPWYRLAAKLERDLAAAQEARQAAEARAEQNAKDAKEAIAIAGFLFDAWEDGTPCFETDGESGMGASIGKAFKLSNEDFTRCTEFLNRVDPRGAAIDAARRKP